MDAKLIMQVLIDIFDQIVIRCGPQMNAMCMLLTISQH